MKQRKNEAARLPVDNICVRNRAVCQHLCLDFDSFYVPTRRKSLISNARFDNYYVRHQSGGRWEIG